MAGTVVEHDKRRGGSWVVNAAALELGDETRFRELAKSNPDHYRVSRLPGGTLRLEKRETLIGSPVGCDDGKKVG
jgi:hypothetical protein